MFVILIGATNKVGQCRRFAIHQIGNLTVDGTQGAGSAARSGNNLGIRGEAKGLRDSSQFACLDFIEFVVAAQNNCQRSIFALYDEGLYGLGDILARQEQCSRGLAPLSTLDAQFPDSEWADDGLLLQAKCLLATGYRQEAMRLYQDVRDRFPDSPGAGLARM